MKSNQTQKGFTLLETLIAIFILTLAITGPIYIASFAFRNTIDSRDSISAQYLAEEAIEVLKNTRDTRALQNDTDHWFKDESTGFSMFGTANCMNQKNDIDNPSNTCILEKDTDNTYEFTDCSGVCPQMGFTDTAVGNNPVYGKKGESTKSKFTREIYAVSDQATDPIPNKEVLIVVNMKWSERGTDKIYTVKERLYNMNYKGFFNPTPEE